MTAERLTTVVTPTDRALMLGDVKSLAPADRIHLVRQLVDDAGLRWGGSPPVILVSADGRLVPYLTKSGADMLAQLRGASIVQLDVADSGDTIDVTAHARASDGRTNVDTGSCEYQPDQPKTRARARMVATTRARRRVILGLLGSGFAWSQEGDAALGLEDSDD